MAKAASPLRLQEDLLQAATTMVRRFHRSTAEQIEYWADLGRQASEVINPDILLALTSGLVRIKVEPVDSVVVDPVGVFQALEVERRTGMLGQNVTGSAARYQASESHPGYLERIDSSGGTTIGQFVNGVFSSFEASSG